MLLYLCALARNPDSAWLRHWSPRLGAASLSMFALHVPLYNLFMTVKQLVRGAPGQCLNQWSDCVATAAANV
ncbi:hypothetical protein [Sodalis sp. (in: enterobacteria)]|uniref:hypothetical protein n=1 Tax=Sodalis sp. (in: enterobacteria) TaxID=1898979 RepID=UPI003F688301